MNITIRAVRDEVRDELADRARRSGRSLQEYLTAELERMAATPSRADVLAMIAEHASEYPPISTASIVDAVRAGRD